MNYTYTHRKRRKAQGRKELVILLLAVISLITAAAWTVPAEEAVSSTQEAEVAMSGITIEPQVTKPEIQTEAETEEPQKRYLGEFTVTAYCSCEICCGKWANDRPNGIVYTASGAVAEEGVTVGASWDVIPAGTHIEIEGLGERIVQDRPADWIVERYDGKIIDAYFADHQAALDYGKQTVDVWIIEGKEE